MKIIDKTVLDVHEPENTNVIWAEPVKKGINLHIFNDDKWNTVGGSDEEESSTEKEASTTIPLMDGIPSVGSELKYARGDHRHPSDATKANKPSGNVVAGHVATLDASGNLVDSGFLGTNIGKEYKIDNSGSTPIIRDSSNNIVNSYSAITADDWLVDTSNNVIYRCFGIETNKLYFRGIGHDGEHVGGYKINTSNNELALLPDPEYLQSGYLKTVNGNSLEGTGDIKVGGKTYYVTYSSGTFTIYDSDNNLITDTSVLREEDVLVYRYNNSEYYYYCSEVSSNTKTYITDTVPPPGGLAGISSYQGELAGLSYDASILQVSYSNKTLKYYNSSGSTGNIVTAAQIVADGLTFDSTPTAGSNNPVTSAGIKAYVDNATPTITMDDTPTSGSSNAVKSSGIYNALQGKQNTLTFDSTPTASSTNPVTSGGVKAALDLKANQSTTYTKTEVDALFDDVAYLGDDDGQATTLDFDPQADTVWNIPQTLGSSQQAQARANIGVVDVSGTNDGTNWTSITIGSTTKAIPSGGSSGDVNVIESITFNGTAATIDSTTKNAAISYTPPVTSVNNQTGAVSLTLGDVNTIETVKVNGTALTPDANKAVDITVPSAVTESTVSGWGFTKNTGNVSSTTITTIVSLTEAQYTALSTKDSSTLYVILES